MSSPRPITIVHLSDTQFGRHHRFGRLSPTAPDDSFDSLVGRLQQDLENLRKTEGLTPDLLAVTGDLAESGMKREFDDVLRFLHRMEAVLGLGRQRVLIIPGNHDINRKACEAYFNQCEANEETPGEPYWPKLQHYASFFERFYEGLNGIRFTQAEPWTLYEIEELRLVIAGLNSTWKESHRKEDHHGWVGEKQLRWFAEKLRTYRERGWLRLGLVHHNVLRGAMEDDENLRDADALERILGAELSVLLHGHTHEGRLGRLGRLPVLSTGSASVVRDARPQEVPNQYQLIRIYPDRIWFGTRQYAPDQNRWIGDTRSSTTGNQWFHEEPVTLEQVGETFGRRSVEDAARTDHLVTLVASYRTHIAEALRYQTLYDLSTHGEDQDIPGGMALLDIFIPQSVDPMPPARDLPQREDIEAELRLGDPEDEPLSLPGGQQMTIEQALLDPESPWVFLMGAPGAGKTSLTRWLCLKLCAAGESLPQLSSDLVPVRVELRRFDERYRAATAQGRSYDFLDYLDQEHAEKALALRGDPLRELNARGRLLWLFDGMDEVSDVPARQRYTEMIVGVRRSGGSRGLITSRIVGARPVLSLVRAAGLPVYTLLDFDEEQIQEFIDRWHERAFPGAPEARTSRQERLERVIAESSPVRDLCRNPLLLTLIALLNRGGELPRRRHLLYRRAVELMAAQWEANKQLPPAEVTFELEDKTTFLRELAWWMQFGLEGGHRNLVGQEDLLKFTSQFFQERQGKAPEQSRRYADLLIRHLRERSYILARIGENRFGFVHKTFFEYLVAEAIRSRFAGSEMALAEIQDLFLENWEDGNWHEVLTLICGMLEEDRPANVVAVLQPLLSELEIFNFENLKFGVFAVRCLAEVRQLDQEPIRTFMRGLAEFAQHEMSNPDFALGGSSAEFSEAIHQIGPRWPQHEIWQQWALKLGSEDPNLRLMANQCAVDTMPSEEHLPLLIALLEAEQDSFVSHGTLAYARLQEPVLRSLMAGEAGGGDGVRYAVAVGVLERGWFSTTRFADALAAEAEQTLRDLLQHSGLLTVRVRCALRLADYTPEVFVQEALLECLRDPSIPPMLIVESISALGRFAFSDSQASELKGLWQRSQNIGVRTSVLTFLLLNGRAQEGFQLMQEWLEQSPSDDVGNRLVALLQMARDQKAEPKELLERWQGEEGTEVSRRIAASVYAQESVSEPATAEDHINFRELPLEELLEHARSGSMSVRRRAVLMLSWHHIPATLHEEVRELLRGMVIPDVEPWSRFEAARMMKVLALVPDEEWLAVLRSLADSCSDEFVRLTAARMLGEEGRSTIEWLAAHATDKKVRTQARNADRSLQLRAALQEVGRHSQKSSTHASS
jgi:3',5'-cyclic AMP phosphodiesterase CpdA